MRKFVKIGLMMTAALTFLTGCTSGNKTAKDKYDLPESRFAVDKAVPSWQKDTDHPAKIRWYVNYEWYAPSKWGMDVISKKIKEDMNIEVEFISGNTENLNTMMASGDMPDIVTFDRALNQAKEGRRFAIPLNLLAQKYDPYFLESAAKKETLNWFTEDDGNIYGYPSYTTSSQDYKEGNAIGDAVFIVRKDIYEAIGSPDMSTPEGFLNALRAAKKQFQTTDDGAPLVAFGSTFMDIANGVDGAFGSLLQDFLNIPVTQDGKYFDRDSNDDYIQWLDTFRQAYQEGLISPDQFSDDDNTTKEKLIQGRYFAFLHNNARGLAEYMSKNNARNPKETYIAVEGPRNSKGEKPTFAGGTIGGWTETFITRSTKEPQKAMELLTYMISDYGTMVTEFGVEGQTYTLDNNGKAVYTEATEQLRNTDFNKFQEVIGIGNYWLVSNENYAISKGLKPATTIRQMVAWSADKLAPRFELEDIDPSKGFMSRNLLKLNTSRVQAIVAFLQAPTSQAGRKIWQDYLKNRDKYHYQEILDYRNQQIAKNFEKMKR